MITFKAYVVEIEPDNSCEVHIEGGVPVMVRDNGEKLTIALSRLSRRCLRL